MAGNVRAEHDAAAQSMTANPEVFNKGQLDRPGPSAGPFADHVVGPHRAANHADPQPEMVERHRCWTASPIWCLDDAALIPALQNNTIDATGVTSQPELTTARNTTGISIRRARRELVSLHVQRGERFDPRGQGATAGGRQGASTGRPSPM